MSDDTKQHFAFLDTETTGLDPLRHEVWEVGLIVRGSVDRDDAYLWQLPVEEFQHADPMGLRVGRFHDRRWPPSEPAMTTQDDVVIGRMPGYQFQVPLWRMEDWAAHFVELTREAFVVGICPHFDMGFLDRLLHRVGQVPMWHYQPIDAEAVAAGALGLPPPWPTQEIMERFGVEMSEEERHTALGDARMAMDLYDVAMHHGSGRVE